MNTIVKKITALIILILIILLFFYIKNINDFEKRLTKKIIQDNKVGSVYTLEDFMRPNLYTLFGEVDQINIYNGYDLSNQKRKFVFYQNGKQVKMISTQLEGIGEEKKGQVFLWSNEVDVAYQCTPKSKIIVMDISDSELYYIKPIDCIVISDIYKP